MTRGSPAARESTPHFSRSRIPWRPRRRRPRAPAPARTGTVSRRRHAGRGRRDRGGWRPAHGRGCSSRTRGRWWILSSGARSRSATSRPGPRCDRFPPRGAPWSRFRRLHPGRRESLKGAFYPAGFVPGDPPSPEAESESTVRDRETTGRPDERTMRSWGRGALPGSPWFVKLDAGDAMERARVEGAAVLSAFTGPFCGSRWRRFSPECRCWASSADRSALPPALDVCRLGRPRVAHAAGRDSASMPTCSPRDLATRAHRALCAARRRRGRAARARRVQRSRLHAPRAGNAAGATRARRHRRCRCASVSSGYGGRWRRPAPGSISSSIPRSPECASTATPSFTRAEPARTTPERYARDASDRTIRVGLSPDGRGVALSVPITDPGSRPTGWAGSSVRSGGEMTATPRPASDWPDTRPRPRRGPRGNGSYRDATGGGAVSRSDCPGDGGENASAASIPLRQPVRRSGEPPAHDIC